jgi:hypothetical protein
VQDFAKTQAAVTEYIRDYILALRRRGSTWQEIGEHLGTSHVWPQQICNPAKYGERIPGPEIEARLAHLLHGDSIDALRRAALHVQAGGKQIVEVVGEALTVERTPALLPSPSERPSEPNPTRRRRRA